MANPFLGVRIPPDINDAISSRVRTTGQTKSDIVVAALRHYLNLEPCQSRLAALEDRLAALELKLKPLTLHSAEVYDTQPTQPTVTMLHDTAL